MKYRLFIFALFIIYLVAATTIMIWQGIGIAPDRYALILLLGALLIKRTRAFLLDWIPFLFILISYDFLRGLVPLFNKNIHFIELINAEKFIFGFIPTQTLQALYFRAGHLQFWDFLATIFYFLHFALPLTFGYLLWMDNRTHFRQFIVAISLMSYTAWATFLAFPSAPPWMAGQKGLLPGVTKILDLTLGSFPAAVELPTLYHNMNPNPVAAMPSMHGAYPFLVLLFAIKFFRWKGLFFLPYVAGVWLSMVYLGEHYFIDLLAGAIYAVIFFYATGLIFSRFRKLQVLQIRF